MIASAAQTPVGSSNGAFANTPAHDLGTVAIEAALNRAKVAAEEVEESSTASRRIWTHGRVLPIGTVRE